MHSQKNIKLYFLCYASPSNKQFLTTEYMKKYHRSTYNKMGQHTLSTHTNHTKDDVCLSFFLETLSTNSFQT